MAHAVAPGPVDHGLRQAWRSRPSPVAADHLALVLHLPDLVLLVRRLFDMFSQRWESGVSPKTLFLTPDPLGCTDSLFIYKYRSTRVPLNHLKPYVNREYMYIRVYLDHP